MKSEQNCKYRFEKLHITAHSLGGLVARSFIMDYGKAFPNIDLFISKGRTPEAHSGGGAAGAIDVTD